MNKTLVGNDIYMYQMLAQRSALKLNIKTGMQIRSGSPTIYSHIKKTYNLKGNKKKVFEMFSELIMNKVKPRSCIIIDEKPDQSVNSQLPVLLSWEHSGYYNIIENSMTQDAIEDYNKKEGFLKWMTPFYLKRSSETNRSSLPLVRSGFLHELTFVKSVVLPYRTIYSEGKPYFIDKGLKYH
jgi:hypothetical protein